MPLAVLFLFYYNTNKIYVNKINPRFYKTCFDYYIISLLPLFPYAGKVGCTGWFVRVLNKTEIKQEANRHRQNRQKADQHPPKITI